MMMVMMHDGREGVVERERERERDREREREKNERERISGDERLSALLGLRNDELR